MIPGFVSKLGSIASSQVSCLPWPNLSPSPNDTCTCCYCWHLVSKWWKPRCTGEKGAVTASTWPLHESPGQHDPGPCQGHVCQRAWAKAEFSNSSLNPSGVLLVPNSFQFPKEYKGADRGVMAGAQPVGSCLAREWYRLSSSRWFSMTVGNQKENNL